jgi:hypothetical protein
MIAASYMCMHILKCTLIAICLKRNTFPLAPVTQLLHAMRTAQHRQLQACCPTCSAAAQVISVTWVQRQHTETK